MNAIIDLLLIVFLLAGTGFVFIAALGVVRLPDVPMRMHASTKAGTLGVMLIAVAVFLTYPTLSIFTRAMALVLFMLLTAPVAAHMMGRASYASGERMGVTLWEGTVIDQFKEDRKAEGGPIPQVAAVRPQNADGDEARDASSPS